MSVSARLADAERAVLTVARIIWRFLLLPPLRLLWRLLPPSARRYLAARFADVTAPEAWGYGVWGLMGAVVAVPELWAAAAGSGFTWPTISSTIGHLEDVAPVVAVAPVALLIVAAYAVLRYRVPGDVVVLPQAPPAPGQARTFRAVQRSMLGRLVRGELDLRSGQVEVPARNRWPIATYFAAVSVVIAAASFAASLSENNWLTGYVLYSLIGLLWIVLPGAASYWAKRDIPFLTLFFTLRSLERRIQLVAYAVAAGLGILLVHLALYPWPDLARGSAQYAGLTPGHAQERAEAAVARLRRSRSPLFFRTKYRGISNEQEAWLVYFRTASGTPSGCIVALTEQTLHTTAPCRSRP